MACALLKAERIGIDVERIKRVDITDYKAVFTPDEFRLINESSQPLEAFFHFWTRKEAVMKADGRGFYLNPETFSAVSDCIAIAGYKWRVKKLPFPEGYVGHMAFPFEKPIVLQQLTTRELLRSGNLWSDIL